MATILRTIFLNIISMKICNLIETSLNFFSQASGEMHLPARFDEFWMYVFKLVITNKIST